MSKILNYGSVNIDEVFIVPHICRSGETLSSTQYITRAGGKGANQSVALAKAGGNVYHAGLVGSDATWIAEYMSQCGVDASWTKVHPTEKNGRAIIQVSEETGDNCIVLYPGTNAMYTVDQARKVLSHFCQGDWLVMQNEISHGGDIMRLAQDQGLSVLFNPAPLTKGILGTFPFDKVAILVVNEHEAADLYKELGGSKDLEGLELSVAFLDHFEHMQGVIITLGAEGIVATFQHNKHRRHFSIPSRKVAAKDTTGAGDTFVGFFLATLVNKENKGDYFERVETALNHSNVASSIAVQQQGSMESIPTRQQVLDIIQQ